MKNVFTILCFCFCSIAMAQVLPVNTHHSSRLDLKLDSTYVQYNAKSLASNPDYKIYHSYNKDCLIAETLTIYNDSISGWDKLHRHINRYNKNNQLVSQTKYNWDLITENWINFSLDSIIYNTASKKIDSSYYEYKNNRWEAIVKTRFAYNANDLIETETVYQYLSIGNETLIYRFTNNYNLNKILIQRLGHKFNQNLNQYELSDLWDFYPNSNSSYDSIIYTKYYDKLAYPEERQKFTYQNDGRLEKLTTEFYNIGLLNYADYAVSHYSYNDLINHDTIISYFWDNEAKELNFTDSRINFYSSKTVNTKDASKSKLNIYPNPGVDYIIIPHELQNSQITIYNLFGKQICSNQKINGNKINISDLTPGIYLLKFSGRTEYSHKFIKG